MQGGRHRDSIGPLFPNHPKHESPWCIIDRRRRDVIHLLLLLLLRIITIVVHICSICGVLLQSRVGLLNFGRIHVHDFVVEIIIQGPSIGKPPDDFRQRQGYMLIGELDGRVVGKMHLPRLAARRVSPHVRYQIVGDGIMTVVNRPSGPRVGFVELNGYKIPRSVSKTRQ